MRILIAYTAVASGVNTFDFATRFVGTYLSFPPGIPHDTVIVCNGGAVDARTGVALLSLPNAAFFVRSNDGWDIGGYIDVANGPGKTYDMLLCMGESCYFHKEGWLKRICEAWSQEGPGMYGIFATHNVRAHMNTTAFACYPGLLRAYPRKVVSRQDRYEFEHGEGALWRMAKLSGLPTVFVTWDGSWYPGQWRFPRNILWRGDQSNLLCWCNHVDRYVNSDQRTRQQWARNADAAFR